jgi:hypothetical protein
MRRQRDSFVASDFKKVRADDAAWLCSYRRRLGSQSVVDLFVVKG